MGSWMTQPARIVKRNNVVIPTLQIHPWRLGWGGCRVDQVDIATIHARVTNQHVDPCRTPPWVHLTLLIINNTLVTAPTPLRWRTRRLQEKQKRTREIQCELTPLRSHLGRGASVAYGLPPEQPWPIFFRKRYPIFHPKKILQ